MFDRTQKPTPSGKIDFELPEIHNFSLNNSLRVYYVKKKTLPIVQINLILPAGSIYEPDNKYGLSTLTSMLIDEGAGNLSSLEISDTIDTLGSVLNINSNKEFATISLLTLKENLKKSLEIFSLITQSPNFNESDFERELPRLKTHILQLNDDPSYLASTEFQKNIYESTPYQFPSSGIIESINLLLNSEIKKFYMDRFLPSSSFLIIVGDLELDEVTDYFNDWQINKSPSQVVTSIKKTKKQIVLLNKPDTAQSEIIMGHFSKGRSSEDFYARTVLNSILGGQFSSRINLNLREDKGFTYGAHSNYSYNQLGSTFTISTSVKTENTSDAIKEIIFELENVKTISEEEVDFSKSYLMRRYPSLFETYSQVATNLSFLPIFNLDSNYFVNYINNISKVSRQQVLQAAHENILLEELVIVVVGNKKVIGDDLTKLADSINANINIIT